MKIAIAGYGVEGEANYKYWNTPANDVTIVDAKEVPDHSLPEGASVILGDDAFSRLDDFDLVVRTAGLAPSKIKTNGKIWSATNEFFEKCPAVIIGVTGSKGKGTTSSIIAHILRAKGLTVHLLGNIGVPALKLLPEIVKTDIIVYELSSFQLWDLKQSPQTGVVVHIEADHLDVHESLEEYVFAKGNIARYQEHNARLIYNQGNKWAEEIATLSAGVKLPYPADETAHVYEGNFWYGEQLLCSVDTLNLPGLHNQENACAAITAVWPWVQDGKIIGDGIKSFKGLDHRLKFVKQSLGVAYYDDSIATTPGSAIAALKAFNEPKIVIFGGSSKSADFTQLARVASTHNVKQAILIGAEADSLEIAFKHVGVECRNLGSSVSMREVVDFAKKNATSGDVVILSPACASFDMFKSYEDRGDQFIRALSAV